MPLHDFSTNANAAGPCPAVLQRLQRLVPDTYPDPAYTVLRQRLARWHGVTPRHVVIGASASELIMRLTAASRPDIASVRVPRHAYGDYRRAAEAWGLPVHAWESADRRHVSSASARAGAAGSPMTASSDRAPLRSATVPSGAGAAAVDRAAGIQGGEDTNAALSEPGGRRHRLIWITWPASPQGDTPPALDALAEALTANDMVVLDMAYAPLRLDGRDMSGPFGWSAALPPVLATRACRLFSPNKALGLTGVRGAYLLLPEAPPRSEWSARLLQLAPSWPLGAHGQAMLEAWMEAEVQQWLAESRQTLRDWKAMLEAGLRQRGWQLMPGVASFCCARPPLPLAEVSGWLAGLRERGIKLRDATSFGLPGWVRLGVRPPCSQQALWQALDTPMNERTS